MLIRWQRFTSALHADNLDSAARIARISHLCRFSYEQGVLVVLGGGFLSQVFVHIIWLVSQMVTFLLILVTMVYIELELRQWSEALNRQLILEDLSAEHHTS